MDFPIKIVIFHCYVSSPEGKPTVLSGQYDLYTFVRRPTQRYLTLDKLQERTGTPEAAEAHDWQILTYIRTAS